MQNVAKLFFFYCTNKRNFRLQMCYNTHTHWFTAGLCASYRRYTKLKAARSLEHNLRIILKVMLSLQFPLHPGHCATCKASVTSFLERHWSNSPIEIHICFNFCCVYSVGLEGQSDVIRGKHIYYKTLLVIHVAIRKKKTLYSWKMFCHRLFTKTIPFLLLLQS